MYRLFKNLDKIKIVLLDQGKRGLKMDLSRTIETKFNWWDDTDVKYNSVIEKLEEEAERRIIEMRKLGYSSGELHYFDDENCISFQGWWESKYVENK